MLSKHLTPSTATPFAIKNYPSSVPIIDVSIAELRKHQKQSSNKSSTEFSGVVWNCVAEVAALAASTQTVKFYIKEKKEEVKEKEEEEQEQRKLHSIRTMTKQLTIENMPRDTLNSASSTLTTVTTIDTETNGTYKIAPAVTQLMNESPNHLRGSSLHSNCALNKGAVTTVTTTTPIFETMPIEANIIRNMENSAYIMPVTASINTELTSTATATSAVTVPTTDSVFESIEEVNTARAATLITNARSSYSSSSSEANGRSAALERAYVHDVYENCDEQTGSLRPRVVQLLNNLEPGSVVCDVGCGSGRYLNQCNPNVCTIGADRCYRLSRIAKNKGGEVVVCDNLDLPFRNESFDAVLSLAVIHHFATTDRRINALRELARVLRIGGRVIITVWALEQKHRRFESQDVLVPWQPQKMRNFNYSDEDEDEDFIAPYHAYTEDSTSSRSTGEGDSSSLSSSSPGESCYTFVKRAIQKLTRGRKHAWFLDSWTSKETAKDSSFDCEDVKDLPIELRRLEDLEDFKKESGLSITLKSRSLSNILNPPQQNIVRSRSSVPSLNGNLYDKPLDKMFSSFAYTDSINSTAITITTTATNQTITQSNICSTSTSATTNTISNKLNTATNATTDPTAPMVPSVSSLNPSRRPKLIKQKQSLCDEDFQLPDIPFHMLNNSVTCSINTINNQTTLNADHMTQNSTQLCEASSRLTCTNMLKSKMQKQSSLNEELMAGNRLREKERLRKRLQKQHSLNEAFLCQTTIFSKKLQVLREGFTSKIKNSTENLERATKSGLTSIVQNLKTTKEGKVIPTTPITTIVSHCTHEHHHHNHHSFYQQQLQAGLQTTTQQQQQRQGHIPFVSNFQNHLHNLLHKQAQCGTNVTIDKFSGPVTICKGVNCATTACYCTAYHQGCSQCIASDGIQEKTRRPSHESGSDSSKENSLQSDTSIESEDSFASVIYIPNPEQQQQQLNYQAQHHNSNSSSSNSSSSNGASRASKRCTISCNQNRSGESLVTPDRNSKMERMSSLPTSPLIMPCPPTPAHSPASVQIAVTSPPQIVDAVSAAMAILTPLPSTESNRKDKKSPKPIPTKDSCESRFNFDETHIKQQQLQQQQQQEQNSNDEDKKVKRNKFMETNKLMKLPSVSNSDIDSSRPEVSNDVKQDIKSSHELQQQFYKNGIEGNQRTISPITHQAIKNLPPIPKFRRQQTIQLCKQTFPIVRRSSAVTGAAIPSIPKLLSLEIYNPATDDLDSDSSEPSSPDSIDSVISAPKSNMQCTNSTIDQTKERNPSNVVNKHTELNNDIKSTNQKTNETEIPENESILINNENDQNNITQRVYEPKELTVQLKCQINEKCDDHNNINSTMNIDDLKPDDIDDPFSNRRKKYSERDLIAIRDELRERRLLLANLSNQTSLNQSPTSSSTSSLSSQSRSFTIHEEDEDDDEEENERSYSMQLYENYKLSKYNYKKNSKHSLFSETTYLLQDEDLSNRDEDYNVDNNDYEDSTDKKMMTKCENILKCSPTEDSKQIEEKQQQQVNNNNSNSRKQNDQNLELIMKDNPDTQSNSSTESLESPSQGGATTHHRYYHVFREGELDALINYHVSSLHIVSSYYERASWCVVAEKVQVWTI